MNHKKKSAKVSKSLIYKAVASSTAIETGMSVSTIERQLKYNTSKYSHLALAY